MMRRIFFGFIFVMLSLPAIAADVALNPNHPQRYVVVHGDTLWDISGKFLKYPWHWPDIWQVNSQIENPHLIYPGDVLSLVYRDGKPVLELSRGPKRLSPEIRETQLDKAISTIPLDVIRPFLSRPRVVSEDVLASAPYVVASSDERLISGAGDKVYVKNVNEDEGKDYSIFRGGKVYTDPETNEILGYEAIYTADANVTSFADISTVSLIETTREVMIGDRLLPVIDEEYEMNFFPRSPDADLSGVILSVFDGVSQVGQYQIVVLNRGDREGLEVGHVLSVYQAGDTVKDLVSADRHDVVTLPDEYAGVAMVFKTFEKVSYAIVMKATRAIHVGDKVKTE
jgi:nucleoid-associated protein YgaU